MPARKGNSPSTPRRIAAAPDPRRPPLTRRGSLPAFFRQPTFGTPGGGDSLGSLLAVALASSSATAITVAIVFLKWIRRFAPPLLYYAPTPANRALVAAVPLLLRTYVPNLLSWNAHAAGVFGYLKLPGRRPHHCERVTMPDGGTVCLSWSSLPADGEPIVLLLPGINNDASMGYVISCGPRTEAATSCHRPSPLPLHLRWPPPRVARFSIRFAT